MVAQFFLRLGDDGERVEVRQQENGQLAIGKNQLKLLLIRAPADHALRRKYLDAGTAQWKPRPQLLSGGWTSSHADWPEDLRVVERRTFIVGAAREEDEEGAEDVAAVLEAMGVGNEGDGVFSV